MTGRAPALNIMDDERALETVSIEHALVILARGGDGNAFRRLFERHAPAVRRFLRDQLRNPEAADEATQETFVRAHARLSTVRDTERLLPWLLGIARLVFFEELRARKRARAGGDLPDVDTRPDPRASPEQALIGAEADALLAGALATLSDERRMALVLRVDHGLDYDEIGRVMGWPLQKVKNEIHRARLVLRERLGSYVGGA